ncbi:TetR family transcriptional regulator [Sphingomonas sp. LY29]|uniref:TetR/AcrR family transcriptional regulator n=1 Tax=unclassified Sphingomonas TaxID=196159 RepID=UPI002ADEC0AA|nr:MULTISPECIES: TetR family transcriptional regulator [unclassified Sphingomonas]MEA1072841.1 TetR family transcriptional regulator [Sphingomonas sp. LY160]WRP26860.1 TetR family transcriptional regulator [Sphingomonas sp. LY29]
MNRKRLTPDQSRAAAVAAARDLLREEGVAAITLKSVAARIGRTHANLLHHFGSVAELHRALAEEIARSVAASITGSIGRMRRGEARLRDVVEGMFDAFVAENVGELMAWVVLTRQREALQPVVDAIAQVIVDISEPGEQRPLDQATLGLVLLAIGDSLAGSEVARACGLPRSAARDIAVQQVIAVLAGRRVIGQPTP